MNFYNFFDAHLGRLVPLKDEEQFTSDEAFALNQLHKFIHDGRISEAVDNETLQKIGEFPETDQEKIKLIVELTGIELKKAEEFFNLIDGDKKKDIARALLRVQRNKANKEFKKFMTTTAQDHNSSLDDIPLELQPVEENPTEIIVNTVKKAADNNETPKDTAKELSKKVNLEDIPDDQFEEILDQLKKEEDYYEDPSFFQIVSYLFTHRDIKHKKKIQKTRYAIKNIKYAETVKDFLEIDRRYFGNKYVSDKLKGPWRKKLEKVARATIKNATKEDKEELINIINGNEKGNFWLAKPAKEQVYDLAKKKFIELFSKEEFKKLIDLEEKIARKLKPLIRELMHKGR